MNERRLNFWGWGYEDEWPVGQQLTTLSEGLRQHIGFGGDELEMPINLDQVELPSTRLKPPAALTKICSDAVYDRVTHAYGKSYRDVIRAFRGQFDHPPDVVAYPANEAELERVLEWCVDQSAAAIPFGGGTSVVGGVEPDVGNDYAGAVSIDLKRMDQVLDIDSVSKAARIQAGATGPKLEDQLKPHGLSLRHYPQSYEFSTLGGWIATRSAGHFATLNTHIDDLVESIRMLTPKGIWESRRLPGSGAGPSPDRMLIGSEGILGVITESWVRVHGRPEYRASSVVQFPDFKSGSRAVRAIGQAGLYPANCRLVDPVEAALTGTGTGDGAVLLLTFESADHPVDQWLSVAVECCREYGGTEAKNEGYDEAGRLLGVEPGTDQAESWRDAFLRAPYLRDIMVAMGVVVETFETAITWDKFEEFHSVVSEAVKQAVVGVCGTGTITCRLTHVYPDGVAPYFTVLAPAKRGSELEQWREVKEAASEAVLANGGTITHHHSIGRDHRPWYDRQRPEPFADVLTAAKKTLDPAYVLNPGVLLDPS